MKATHNLSPVVIITGAANGIARQLAQDLLSQDRYRLVLCDIDAAGLRHNFDETAVYLHSLDVTKLEQWQGLFVEVMARYGRVDILYNIAGILIPGWIHEIDVNAIDKHIDINVKGVMYGSKLASEIMVQQGSGHIINMSSLAGIAFTPGNSLYCASKHAVRGFSHSLAVELRQKGVSVSCLCPGVVNTGMMDVQIDRKEAALTFSAGDPLSPVQISRLLQQVLTSKAIEICQPAPFMPKLVNVFPFLGVRLYQEFVRRGQARAAKLQRQAAFGNDKDVASGG